MSPMFIVFQALFLTSLLLVCSYAAIRRFLPGLSTQALAALSARLAQPRQGRLLRNLGRWLSPADEGREGGCASGGCSSCSGCAIKTRLNRIDPDRSRPVGR